MIKDLFSLAMRSIFTRKLRSWLTVIGIFIGITAVVALISLGLGLERTIIDQIGQIFGVDTIMIIRQPERPGAAPPLIAIDFDLIHGVEGVAAVATLRSETGFVSKVAEDDAPVRGLLTVVGLSQKMISEFQPFIGEFTLKHGRILTADDTYKAFLGHGVATQLRATIGAVIEIEDQRFEVIGILEPDPEEMRAQAGVFAGQPPVITDETIFIPFALIDELFEEAGAHFFLVKVDEGAQIAQVAEEIGTALTAAGVANAVVMTFEDIQQPISMALRAVQGFLAALAAISLLVGGVGVMNTMYTAVLERTKEIGVMKAVGAKNSHILSLFLVESGLIGLVGGVIGVIIGLLLSTGTAWAVLHFFDIEIMTVISVPLIAGAIFFSFIIGSLAGMLPARRASKLHPIEALRYE